jgi:DNA polymerase-1
MLEVAGSFICQNMEEAEGVIRRALDQTTTTLGYDSETTGLEPRTDTIVGHVISFGPNPPDTYYVPVRHGDPARANVHASQDRYNHPFELELRRVAARRNLHWFGHNFDFDLRFLYGHGIDPLGTLEDTMVNQALLNEYTPSFSLEACCGYAGVQGKKGYELYRHLANLFGGAPERSQMGNYWRLAGDDLIGGEYACGDGVSTWQLRDAQHRALELQNLMGICRTEQKVTRMLYRMFKRGVPIDTEQLAEVEREADRRLAEGRKALPEGFNPRASTQMKKLMTEHGHTDWPMTEPSKKFPQGQPSYKEEWLLTHDIGRKIVAVRKYEHLKSAFLSPLRDEHLWPDKRVRPRYYQMASDDFGTVTGRFSCSAPNLQQVPKRNKEIGHLFRKVFVPSEGSRWLTADLSQCEPRILAHYSEARVLVNGYMSVPFVDAHAAVTIDAKLEELLGIPFKEAREYGKRVNQTLITGGGKGKIVSMLGKDGLRVYDAYFEAMPEVKAIQKSAADTQLSRGFVRSLCGRRARLESRDKAYKALNRLLQVGNADVIKEALIRMDEYFESEGDDVGIINTVHDSVDIDVPEGREDVGVQGLRFMCEYGPGRRVDMLVPMAVEYSFGSSWSEATYDVKSQMMGEDPHDASFIVTRPDA